jgi:hypothetical protein
MPATPAPPLKRGGRPHRVLALLAAHPDGLISRQLAELDGSGTGQRMLTRYGDALRALRDAGRVTAAGAIPSGRRNTLAIIYQVTDAGREYLAALEAPAPGPPERRRPEYPWAQEAARRNRAGESVTALGREYKVCAGTVRRALERRGIPVLRYGGKPRWRPQPEWAAEAARRYRDGEPRSALCTPCKVSDRRMTRVLTAEGVALRGRRETLRLRASPARQPGPQPDGQLPDHTPASAFPALGEAM